MTTRHPIHEGGAECLAVADVNRNGWPDIVWTDWNAGEVRHARNSGDGTFTVSTIATGLPWAREIHFADLYQNGRGGFLVAAYGNSQPEGGFYFLELNADGSWTKEHLASHVYGASDIIASDLDGDGRPDLVTSRQGVGSDPGLVRFHRNLGNGTFQMFHERVLQSPSGLGVFIGMDGKRRIVVGDYDGAWTYLLNYWGSLEGPYPLVRGIGAVGSLSLADLDNDGKEEIVLCGSSACGLRVVRQTGEQLIIDPSERYYAAAADLNHDGLLDLAGVSLGPSHELAIFWQGPVGTWTKETLDSGAGQGGRGVAIADFNRDGKPDLAVTSYSNGTLAWWEQQ